MAEADQERDGVPHVSIPTRGHSPWVKGMACVAMLPLLGFIGQTGHTLWGEWESLRQDRVSERASAVVGYINITPRPSFASRPRDWLHDEGEDSLLWSGWKDGKNHWFRIGRGDLEGRPLSMPLGRDVIQAIDHPLYEKVGGTCWARVPHEAAVVSIERDGMATAYPLRVLDKVEVINERSGDRSILVAYTPEVEVVSVYDATLDGHRVTMGHCGYFFGNRPVLYDRGTESLWSEQDGAMVAVTGRRKGAKLKRIALLDQVAWGDWRASHPDGRLVVGADRSQPKPVD